MNRALETNSNYTLNYLQIIMPYIIIEYKMHYVSLEKKILNLKHFQITNIDNFFFFFLRKTNIDNLF